MIGVGGREPVVDLLRSGAFHSWFDTVGVQDLPAVFAGEIIERFDFTEHGGGGDEPGHAVIAAIVAAQDTALLAANPDQAKLLAVRAKLRIALGRPADAERDAAALLVLDPHRALALYTALALALRAPGSAFTPIIRYVVGKVSPGEVFW